MTLGVPANQTEAFGFSETKQKLNHLAILISLVNWFFSFFVTSSAKVTREMWIEFLEKGWRERKGPWRKNGLQGGLDNSG